MEERRTIFDYLGQVFVIYGITIVMLNVFCLLFGEDAKEISTMFGMGNKGLSVATMVQFFLIAVIITTLRFLFFTDILIKQMPVIARAVCMVVLVLAACVVFIVWFGWFPVNMWQTWLMFLVCFGICFLFGTIIASLKEREENKKMAEALERLKQENNEIKS